MPTAKEDLKIIRSEFSVLNRLPDKDVAEYAARKYPEKYSDLPDRVEANRPADVMRFLETGGELSERAGLPKPIDTSRFIREDITEVDPKVRRQQLLENRVKDVQDAGALGKALSFAGGVAQAGTFGGSDEIIGTVRYLKDKADGDVVGTRDDYIEQARLESDILQKSHPATFFGGEIGGVAAQAAIGSGIKETVAGTKAGIRLTKELLRLKDAAPRVFDLVTRIAPSAADGFARGFMNSRSKNISDRVKAGAFAAGIGASATGVLVGASKIPGVIKKKVPAIITQKAAKVAAKAKEKIGVSVAKAFGFEKGTNRKLQALNRLRTQTGEKTLGKVQVLSEVGNVLDDLKALKRKPENLLGLIKKTKEKIVPKRINNFYKSLDKKGVSKIKPQEIIDNIKDVVGDKFSSKIVKGKEVLVPKSKALKKMKGPYKVVIDTLNDIKTDAKGAAKYVDLHEAIQDIGDFIFPSGIGKQARKSAKYGKLGWIKAKNFLNKRLKSEVPGELQKILDLNRKSQVLQVLPDKVFEKTGEKLLSPKLLGLEKPTLQGTVIMGALLTGAKGPSGLVVPLIVGGVALGAIRAGRIAGPKISRGYNRAIFDIASKIANKSKKEVINIAQKEIAKGNIPIPSSFLAKKGVSSVAARMKFAEEMAENAFKINKLTTAQKAVLQHQLNLIASKKDK
jgi:hypothetical protein